jgi:hypothetical protein
MCAIAPGRKNGIGMVTRLPTRGASSEREARLGTDCSRRVAFWTRASSANALGPARRPRCFTQPNNVRGRLNSGKISKEWRRK